MKSYLNVGCGAKFHKDWTNVDMVSSSPHVIRHNLLKGFPFSDNIFDAVYHSQVLEHFPKEEAFKFIKECHRVLKKNGVIRIVVPDLENIVVEYKKYLDENLNNPSRYSEANYDWILLEMYDQTVRNFTGGQMGKILKQKNLVNEHYLVTRGMTSGNRRDTQSLYSKTMVMFKDFKNASEMVIILTKVLGYTKRKIVKLKRRTFNFLLGEKYRIGDFRLSGEVHQWMYDRFSLSRLLSNAGFEDIKVKNSYESEIPDWELFELDVKDGRAYAPSGLFIEAKKSS